MFIICLFEKYYIRVNESNWDEIYNPNYATTFKSKKEANDWVDRNTTLKQYAQIVDSKKAIKKYDEWEKDGSIRRSFDLVDNNLSRPYAGESPEEVLKWMLEVDIDKIRYEDYKTWPDLHSLFKHIHRLDKFHSDDYTKQYTSFSFYFKPDSNFEEFKKEFDLVVEKTTYEKDGYKVFDIFDRFLCEGGNSVDFFYKNDEDCYVGGRWSKQVSGSLKECFEYLKKERYYE
ncbi:MAG: hypothetical protein EKK64_00745 [Neisseriaceae bacterium]|nr:MAG: hypothetical protein EKK64_00745 [Neisseriaceae bacterium]